MPFGNQPRRIHIILRNRVRDKALAMNFLKSAVRNNKDSRPEFKALVYQNLSMVCFHQKLFQKAEDYNKQATSYIKPFVMFKSQTKA